MPQQRTVFVSTPSRLHFGLLSFGNPDVRQFGGAGVMIDRPGLRLRIDSAESLEVVGALSARIRETALRWLESSNRDEKLRCRIEVVSAPSLHAGLGVGTQLALAVAAGLNKYYDLEPPNVEALAKSVGRGRRSAVGTYGFEAGGLIAEQGKLSKESMSPLIERVAMPSEWRFVLATPSENAGLHGAAEQSAFDQLPPVSLETTNRLTRIMCDRMLPAAKSANFSEFSDAVYDFGFLAGSCFEPIQGGAYNGPALEHLVKQVRSLGVRGVGQSSWGPTIYSLCESESQANSLAQDLQSQGNERQYEIAIAAPDNRGASVLTDLVDL
ncbi:MAG: beta-RFAP synthase [Planctomycetaceae bacterium]|nr:hypothetical protein [Planctomycetales bacterium]MCB9936745.1 beta-RFAP synthase [Planctomycetaceae bacterium]